MHTPTSKMLVVGLAFATVVGCGNDEPVRERTLLAFVQPLPGQVLNERNTKDVGEDWLRYDVQLNVTSNQEDAVLTVSVEGIDGSFKTYTIEGNESGDTVSFNRFYLPEGEVTLVATVTEGGEVVTQEEVTFLVNPSNEPGPQPQVEIVRPADGSQFDASDDNDPGSPGFQTVVRATTLEVSDGTEFTLSLNDSAAGTATVVDAKTNAVLEVRFNEWFSVFIPRARQGNYFIVWLAPDYSAAAVGTPDRKCLWILARQPGLPTATYHQIVEHCRKLGFPVENLIVETALGH